jgi:hypothetical protein
MKMRTLKGWILTSILLTTILAGSTFAEGGIIYGFKADTTTTNPCTATTETKTDFGIIYGLTGIIYGFASTGIIVTDFSSKDTVNCGIIVTDGK